MKLIEVGPSMGVNDLVGVFNRLSPRKVALTCHHNADPDSFGSAYAIREFLNKLYEDLNVFIVVPEGLSSVSKRLFSILGDVNILENVEVDEIDLFIMVDSISFIQLGSIGTVVKDSNIPLIVIDHHEPTEETVHRATYILSDTGASSTAEIVTDMYREFNLDISKKSSLALLTALIYDSKRFSFASYKTFEAASFLLRHGGDYSLALSILSEPMDISEKIARLKGAQRLKFFRINKWLISFSNVSSFEASVARALIELGSDLSIVIGGDDEIRVSARSTEAFYKETNFHLGRDLMIPLGAFIGGSGGGHSLAAGANGYKNRDMIQDFCMNLILSKIS
ncbi:MAG: DHH family phosphoesterase [Candidatus Methanomethylicia archaeon]